MGKEQVNIITVPASVLSMSEIASILNECSVDFPFSIGSTNADISSIINKLYSNANWVLLYSENQLLLGFIAFYINREDGFAYIPYVWVAKEKRGHRCGFKMMEELKNNVPDYVKEIRLEVREDNSRAKFFYLKNGFEVWESRGEKLLLICRL